MADDSCPRLCSPHVYNMKSLKFIRCEGRTSQMDAETTVTSACEMCNEGCAVIIHMNDGIPFRIEGDKRDRVSGGAICARGVASLEYLENAQRVKSPLRRTGARGEGNWERITSCIQTVLKVECEAPNYSKA